MAKKSDRLMPSDVFIVRTEDDDGDFQFYVALTVKEAQELIGGDEDADTAVVAQYGRTTAAGKIKSTFAFVEGE